MWLLTLLCCIQLPERADSCQIGRSTYNIISSVRVTLLCSGEKTITVASTLNIRQYKTTRRFVGRLPIRRSGLEVCLFVRMKEVRRGESDMGELQRSNSVGCWGMGKTVSWCRSKIQPDTVGSDSQQLNTRTRILGCHNVERDNLEGLQCQSRKPSCFVSCNFVDIRKRLEVLKSFCSVRLID